MTDPLAAEKGLLLDRVTADGWRSTVERALASGARAASLYATVGELRLALIERGGRERVLSCPIGGEAPTLVDLVPALAWDEREAHDLYGVRFLGHEPLRPLVDHDLRLETWTVPVRGHGPYQVAVGPIHAGVIESGHFRFHVVGERVIHLDVRLFYKHRGLERAAEGNTLADGVPYAQRACAACAVANTVAYATACEQASGLWPNRALRETRTLLLELERLYNHLHDIGQLCAGAGFAAGTMAFLALKERAQRLNEQLVGHRFLFDSVAVGASPIRLPREARRQAREGLREIGTAAARAWHEIHFNGSVQDRLDGVGVLDVRTAHALGTVGPAARASGIETDARTESPRLAYDGFVAVAPEQASGDVRARLEARAIELAPTLAIIDELLGRPLDGAQATPNGTWAETGLGRVESPRGETICVIEKRQERLIRLRLRTASYANWPAVARAATDNLLPDFPLINKSFELCYACADR